MTSIGFRCADGSYKDVRDRGYILRDRDGRASRIIGALLDITERKRAEVALRESEQRWRSLTEALPQMVWSATPDGACDYFSKQWTQHTGVPESDLLGWRWLQVLHPDDREPTRTFWTDSVAGRGPYDVEYRVRRSDGEYRWFKTRGVPIRDDAGNICKWFGTCTDITDLRQTEEALRESEERFRGTFENAAVGIAHRDATGRFLCVNEKFCAIVGYSREELLQKNIQDITHPNDLAVTIDAFTALWQGESPTLGLEKRYVRKDGSLVWIDLFASLQRDAAGKPAYDISIINDISEHKQLEEQLRASEERQRLILDNAHDAFVAMSADGLIAEWNRQAEITFGWPRAEAVGRVLSGTIIPPQFREAHSRGLARFLATAEGPLLNRVLDVQALRRDGSEFPAEISIAPVRLGEHYLFVAFIRDVTERKRAEEEVRQAKEAAEAANRAKDEFLANVSHEIRTPMNAILGMTELVLDTPLTDDQRQCLKTVKSAADNLLGIINDLLDFSKIEAGKLELDPADFSLAGGARRHPARPGRAGPQEGAGADLPRAAGRARRPGRRRRPAAPGPAQPGRQRHQVHRRGRGGRARGGRRRPRARGRGRPALRGERHRHRHLPREAGDDLPGLRAGGHLDHAEVRRHRAGPDDRRPAGGPDGRDDHRGQRAGPGQHLRLHGAVRAAAAPARSRSPPGRRSCSATCRCSSSTTTPPTATSWRSGCAAGRWSRRRWATGWRPWMPSGTPSAWAGRTRWCCSTPACPTPTAWPWPPRSASGPSCPPPASSC